MKKFYSIIVASTVLFNASASEFVSETITPRQIVAKEKSNRTATDITKKVAQKDLGIETHVLKGLRKADAKASIEGNWIFTLGDYYFQTSLGSSFLYGYEATLDGNEVKFEDPMGIEPPFTGIYDEEKSTITFSTRYVGPYSFEDGTTYYVYQEPFVFNYTTEYIDVQDIVGSYNANEGTLSFEPDHGISWPVYVDKNKTTSRGFLWVYDIEGAAYGGVEDDDSSSWTDLGNATFMDGWILPYFDIDQTKKENWYEVPLQQNKLNKNLYRLVDPYHQPGFPALEYNESKMKGYIEFDVTDPELVLVNPNKIESGFGNGEMGYSRFYCYNTLMYYRFRYSGFDDVLNLFRDAIPLTTFKDGIVDLGFKTYMGEIEYDAVFGIPGQYNGGIYWTDLNDNPLNMSARIIFPGADSGVEDIITDNETPVYYNLQGVKIDNPSNGIYIRVTGNKSTKVIKN